ncbi:C40 family peptidase [Trebonia kvetii]|nr:C40 family peptidase [Trebonia kvetii]
MSAMALAAAALGLALGCGRVASPNPGGAAAAPAAAPVAAAPVAAGPAAAAPAVAAPAACASGTCYVAVSVATVWVKPRYPRAVDKPALGNPAHPQLWVRAMTVAQKSWLVGRLETQALYGTKVTVTGHWRNWTQVAVPSQPTNRDRRGYPGWVPTVQLTRTAPPAAATSAVIRSQAAWLWSRWTAGGVAGTKMMLVSYDTRLPVVLAAATYVEVTLIGGQKAAVRRGDVVLHGAGSSWGATRARVVAEARKFLRLPYLWAGTSGFGYDCSGFTYSVYHSYGLTLSRDADQQAVHGTVIARSGLQPGDLVFFRNSTNGPISHVGMYVGGGTMIDAPHTGAVIRIDPVSSFAYYAGARRYLSR